ncbi:hypothetical protein TNCV_4639941 [Trichonephila clavipes]|nr:hypothetical protein TNCV_4639941 [Trichonephila clavipes]
MVPLKIHRMERLTCVKSVEIQSPPVGVVWERDASCRVLSSPLDHGSKLRGPSPISPMLLHKAMLIKLSFTVCEVIRWRCETLTRSKAVNSGDGKSSDKFVTSLS